MSLWLLNRDRTTLFTPVGALVGWLRDRKRNHIGILYDAPLRIP